VIGDDGEGSEDVTSEGEVREQPSMATGRSGETARSSRWLSRPAAAITWGRCAIALALLMFAIGGNWLFVHRRAATVAQPSARPDAIFEQLIRAEPDAGSASALLETYAPDESNPPGAAVPRVGETAGGDAAAAPKPDRRKGASASESARSKAAQDVEPAAEKAPPAARAAANPETTRPKPTVWGSKRKPPEEEEEEEVRGWVIRR
jgi:hypothetical protein